MTCRYRSRHLSVSIYSAFYTIDINIRLINEVVDRKAMCNYGKAMFSINKDTSVDSIYLTLCQEKGNLFMNYFFKLTLSVSNEKIMKKRGEFFEIRKKFHSKEC